MKIVLTAGGSGGHFYPLIAIAERIRDVVNERHLLMPKLYYLAPAPFDPEALFENEIEFIQIPAGRVRRYASFENFLDVFVTIGGCIKALFTLMRLYPDVIISKGGFASVPAVIASKILRIPLIIHESDAKPGRANLLASGNAMRIGIAFESAAAHFPRKVQDKIARVGIPIRKALMHPEQEPSDQFTLESGIPTILILGGSSGSQRINEAIMASLPDLLTFANVIHQTGKDNFKEIAGVARIILEKNKQASRYNIVPYLSVLSMRRAAGAADLVISRAGSTSIAEIALWKKPSILIPIPESVSHDQRTNAYSYAHTGAAEVIEEVNLSPHVLVSEARRITTDKAVANAMSEKAVLFHTGDAARSIAEEAINIALSHEEQ